ncbi:16042_t:CDS:2 [Entrophospora sp. SA101]|nr:16042_t:CDS:2 [Entrophospora sp. SA101]
MTEPILFPQSPTTTKLKIQTINVTKISVKKNNNIITTTTENNTNLKIFSSLINDDNNVRLIDYTEFEDIIALNTECYGLIKKAYWKKEEKYIYLKFINDLEDQLKKINERNNQIIQQSKHENIIQFYGVSQDKEKNNYFLVLQYTNDGSLREYLAKNKENLKWVDKLRLAKDIAAGLKILHDNDIFHGELDGAVSSTTPSYKISVPGIIPYIDPQTFAKRSSPRTHNLQKPREQQQQIKKNDDDEYLNHLKSDIYSLDKEKNNYFLVLQYTNDGSLREYLAKNKENLKWVDKLRLAKDIAAGLKILHDNDIFHGELDDAVSSTTPSYKISVPGIIPYIDPQTFAKRSSPRTHNLQKPREQQQQIKKNDDDEYLNHLKSDIYSLGVILWEISTNKIPFDDSKNQVLLTVSIMIRNKRELPAEVNAEVNDEVNDKVNDEVNAEVNDKDFLVRDKRSSHMETIGDLTTTLSSSSSYRLIKSKSETPENISMNPSTQLQTKDENLDSKPIPKNTLTSKSPCQRFKYI